MRKWCKIVGIDTEYETSLINWMILILINLPLYSEEKKLTLQSLEKKRWESLDIDE